MLAFGSWRVFLGTWPQKRLPGLIMNSNSDELAQDEETEESQDEEAPDQGVELDKLEIPNIPEQQEPASKPDNDIQAEEKPESSEELNTQSSAKPFFRKIPIGIAAAAAVLVTAGIGVFMFINMLPSLSKAQPNQSETKAYCDIDPITTNLGADTYVDVVVSIWADSSKQPAFSLFQTKVKDSILTFLTSPGVRKGIVSSGIKNNTLLVSNELNVFLQKQFQDRVIVRALHIY